MWKRKTKGGRPYVEPKVVPPVVEPLPEEEIEPEVIEYNYAGKKNRKKYKEDE